MSNRISAIILAAGESLRMGQPKLLLPWGKSTVLGQVISIFSEAGVEEVIVVTGGAHEQVENLVAQMAGKYPVRAEFNPVFAKTGMLGSIQQGLRALTAPITNPGGSQIKHQDPGNGTHAALIGLGDQPQVQVETVRRICTAFLSTGAPLVIPSFQNQRGHPWLIASTLWNDFLLLPSSTTPRIFLNAHAREVEYVPADASILQDLDTPEEYSRQRP